MRSLTVLLASLAGATIAAAQPFAYVSNQSGNTIAILNRATNTIASSISVSGAGLSGLALAPNATYLYVTEQNKNAVAILNTATNAITGTIPVGSGPVQVAFTPNGQF